MAKPDKLAMVAYEAAASLEQLTLSSGDNVALLKGTRLDEVANAKVERHHFTPATLNRVEDPDQLIMNAAGSTSGLEPGEAYTAHVELKDGRTLNAPVVVDPPRPQITLLSKGVQQDEFRIVRARATWQPERPARRWPPRLLSQVQCAGGLSPRRKG